MDGGHKNPQAGSKEAQGCKGEAPWKNACTHAESLPLCPCGLSAAKTPQVALSPFPLQTLPVFKPQLYSNFPGSFLWLPLSDYNLSYPTSHQILPGA